MIGQPSVYRPDWMRKPNWVVNDCRETDADEEQDDDHSSCVIVGVQATGARLSQGTVAAQDMLTRFTAWQARTPESVAADTMCGNGQFLQWLSDRNIALEGKEYFCRQTSHSQ